MKYFSRKDAKTQSNNPRTSSAVRTEVSYMKTPNPVFLVSYLFFVLAGNCLAQPPEPLWFRDATADYGAIGDGSAAFADLDGDGWPDLVCASKIFRNDGGKRFVD